MRSRGFTLIEMMISVAIVGVLATVAIPNYINYSLRAKSAEARTLLGAIVTSQEAFCAEFENYANVNAPWPQGQPGMQKSAWAVTNCPAGCTRQTPEQCTRFECIGFAPPGAVYYRYAAPHRRGAGAVTPEFAAGAAGDLDGDLVIGSYAFRSANNGSAVGTLADGISACPADSETRVVLNCAPVSF